MYLQTNIIFVWILTRDVFHVCILDDLCLSLRGCSLWSWFVFAIKKLCENYFDEFYGNLFVSKEKVCKP